jgi:hypothetical protein
VQDDSDVMFSRIFVPSTCSLDGRGAISIVHLISWNVLCPISYSIASYSIFIVLYRVYVGFVSVDLDFVLQNGKRNNNVQNLETTQVKCTTGG